MKLILGGKMKKSIAKFDAIAQIKNEQDWAAAYEIVREISPDLSIKDSFFKVASSRLIGVFILLLARTDYPDFLTLKVLLHLDNLFERLRTVQVGETVLREELEWLVSFGEDSKIISSIFADSLIAINTYFVRSNLSFTRADYDCRYKYLQQYFS